MSDIILVIVGLLSSAISIATPLILAGMFELLVERGGVLNLFLEGLLLSGALTAYLITLYTGNPWIGVIIGGLSGILMNMLFAVLTIKLSLDQIVTGIALNIFAVGLTSYAYRFFIGFKKTIPTISNPIGDINIPYLSDIPYIGKILFTHSVFTYISLFILPIILFIILNQTIIGLKIKAIGEDPINASYIGINVFKYRYVLLLVEGFTAGIAGALYSVHINTLFLENMTGGRGFIIIALIILSGWNPLLLLLGCIFFGFMDALSYYLQTIGLKILPFQFTLMLPYISALLLLAIAGKRIKAPAYLGKTFIKSE